MKLLFLWFALFASAAGHADAANAARQDEQSDPTATALERATVEKRLADANAMEAVEGDDRRAQLVQSYSAALALIDSRDAWEDARERFLGRADNAAARTAEIEAELANEPSDEVSPPAGTIDELEAQRTDASLALERERDAVDRFDKAVRSAPERRLELVGEITRVEEAISEEQVPTTAVSPAEDADPVDVARRLVARAQSEERSAKLASLRVEEATLDARRALDEAELRLARRRFASASARVEMIESALSRERQSAAEAQRAAAELAARDAAMRGENFRRIAEDTLTVRNETVAITASLDDDRAQAERAKGAVERLTRRFEATESRVGITGLTPAVGQRLRHDRQRLLETRSASTEFADIDRRLRATQVEEFDVDILLDSLADEGEWLDEVTRTADPENAEDARALARTLISDFREALVAKREALAARFGYLTDLQRARDSLDLKLLAYEEFVAERILWVRSSKPVWSVAPTAIVNEARDTLDSSKGAFIAMSKNLRRSPALAVGILALVAGLWSVRRRLRRLIAEQGEVAELRSQTSFKPTLYAVALSLAYVVPYAAIWYAVAWFVGAFDSDANFEAAVGVACDQAAAAAVVVGMLRALTAEKGLGHSHFDWTEEGVALVRRQSAWLVAVLPVAAFATGFLMGIDSSSLPRAGEMELLPSSDVERGQAVLARAALVVVLGSLLVFFWRILHPGRGVLALGAGTADDWMTRLRRVWFAFAVLAVGALLVVTGLGFEFTAYSLFDRVLETFAFLIALMLLRATALRWVRLERRREALERLRRKREEQREKREAELERRRSAGEDVEELESQGLEVHTDEVDFAALSSDVRDVVRMFTGVAALVGTVMIWASVMPALGVLDDVRLWSHATTEVVTKADADGVVRASSVPVDEWITLGSLLAASVVLLLTWRAVKDLPSLLEIVLLRRLNLGSGERYAVTTLLRYVLTMVGVIVASDQLGLSWSKLQWLVAGISVGLGFGLQEIFANFVSGITLLFERPIRVGDWVTLGDVEGVVSKIRIRATTIRDRDLKELVVPNREFITGRFINWTLSDPISRVVLPVGIAYGSDTERAIHLLLEVGKECPYSVDEPSPNVVFKAFGESSLDFELRVFVNGREIMPRVVHDLHMRVDAAFRGAEIEISFPQRDLHLRSAVGIDVSTA